MPPCIEQILAARKLADQARLAHARACRRVRDAGDAAAGAAQAAAILRDPPAHTANLRVLRLLCAIHRWGPTRARRVLAHERVSEMKTLGGLTERQREALAGMLDSAPCALAA